MYRHLVRAFLLPLVTVGSTGAQERQAPVEWLRPCTVEGAGEQEVWCGTYEVYENRAARSGRRIGLKVVVLPAQSETSEADPVFFFHGGPGAAATEAIPGIGRVLQGIRASRDLVFIDQRGTGSSHPLDCDLPAEDAPLQEYFNPFLEIDFVRRCLAKQDQYANVALYTTPIAMDDIDEVRDALGYQRINVLGGSYGTRAVLIYLRRHSEHVRSAVLKGIAPTDMKNPLPFAQAAERGLQAVFDACAVEPACHEAFPNLIEQWEKTLAHFAHGPVSAEVEHPENKRRETVRITKGIFADGLRHLMYSVQSARRIPRIIHAASEGDFSVFAQRELEQAIGFGNMLSTGMFLTVTCSEDLRFIKEEEIGHATNGTFLGDYRVRRQLAACEHWELGDIQDSYMNPVTVDTPVLLLSGVYDTATPYEGGEEVARHMSNSLHVIVPNESHGFANPLCEIKILTEFITAGTTEGLDTSCVMETKRPSFVTKEPVATEESSRE